MSKDVLWDVFWGVVSAFVALIVFACIYLGISSWGASQGWSLAAAVCMTFGIVGRSHGR